MSKDKIVPSLVGMVIILLAINAYYAYKNMDISRDAFVGGLVAQYHSDLSACLDASKTNKDLTEEKCKDEVNSSELAKKIVKWGGQHYLQIATTTP